MSRRVVITAMGAVTSLGNDAGTIWENLSRQHTTLGPSPDHGNQSTAPVNDFDIKAHIGRCKNARYLNRGTALAVAAAMDAIRRSGLTGEQLSRAGLFAGAGPNLDLGGEFPEIRQGQMDRPDLAALWMLRFLPNTVVAVVSQLAGIHGENLTLGSACAASLMAIGEAFRKIRDGYLDIALAGGGDSRLNHGGILAYQKAHALHGSDREKDIPYAPFDQNRCGFVPGEGAAFFLLETLEHSRQREATILAEVLGYAATLDAANMTSPDPSGHLAEAAVLHALKDASLKPDAVSVVSAHGTGTMLNDEMEARLIHRVFGDNGPFVTALKSWIGHLASACGAAELAVILTCMEKGSIPPILRLRNPCHDRVNFLQSFLSHTMDNILLENFGFGGQNAALVVRRWVQ